MRSRRVHEQRIGRYVVYYRQKKIKFNRTTRRRSAEWWEID